MKKFSVEWKKYFRNFDVENLLLKNDLASFLATPLQRDTSVSRNAASTRVYESEEVSIDSPLPRAIPSVPIYKQPPPPPPLFCKRQYNRPKYTTQRLSRCCIEFCSNVLLLLVDVHASLLLFFLCRFRRDTVATRWLLGPRRRLNDFAYCSTTSTRTARLPHNNNVCLMYKLTSAWRESSWLCVPCRFFPPGFCLVFCAHARSKFVRDGRSDGRVGSVRFVVWLVRYHCETVITLCSLALG